MKVYTFIFAGPSGCGKGTQVELLKQYLQKKNPETRQFHVYTGDGFRAFIDGKTLASQIARDIYNAGELEPEFLAIWLWADLFVKNMKGDEYLFIDGSPRKLGEAIALDSALQFFKRQDMKVILINVSDKETTRRLLLRGRTDDNKKAIGRRLGWYHDMVVPAVDYFKKCPGYYFVEINGEQTPEKVFEDIVKALAI